MSIFFSRHQCYYLLLIFFTAAILFFFSGKTFAQHPYFYNITDENGLPSNEVYSIVQDSFGYIWLGCDAGLFRYDGFTFQPYNNIRQNGRSISFLQLDKKGRVWCKNFSGQIYRVEGDSLLIVLDFSSIAASTPQFTLDDDCNLYINNFNKIEVYSEQGDSLRIFEFPKRENVLVDINELIFYNGKVYFSRSFSGIYALDLSTGKIKEIDCGKLCEEFSKRISFRKFDKRLFLLSENIAKHKSIAAEIKNEKADIIGQFGVTRAYILNTDRNNTLWLCFSEGVKQITPSDRNGILLKGNKVSNMLHDREGNYWFTTLEHGIFVIPDMNVQRLNSNNSAIKEDNITALYLLQNSNLLAGSYTGNMYEINRSDKKSTIVFADEKSKFITTKNILETNEHIILSRGKVSVVEKKSGKMHHTPFTNFRDMAILGDTLFFVLPEKAGKIHFADFVKSSAATFMEVSDGGGRAVESDEKAGLVYFALNEGTFVYRNGKTEELKDGNEKIFANSISFSDGILWLASVSNGIYGMKENKVVYHFSAHNGLQENTMRCIKAKNNNVIACSNNFLYSLSLGEGWGEAAISKYNTTSGINPKDINAIEITDSLVVLATNKGLIFFPLSLNSINLVEPNIAITKIEYSDSIIPLSSSVRLPYRNSNFNVYFSSTAFRSRGNFTYEYRLKGLDSTWTSVPASQNHAAFSSIPPGEFIFEVRAVNESGLKSKSMESVVISVSRPIWQNWWFYLLVSFISVAGVALLYQSRITYLTRKASLQNQLTASQLTALKARMNPHFMYNALNSIQDLILQSDIKNTNYYLSRFSSLMRKVLDASDDNEITLGKEIEILELYLELEKLRFGNDFKYVVTKQKEIDTDETKLPSMILQLFVENAIKHGLLHKKGEKKIDIDFLMKNGSLFCTVTDNGVGRKRAHEIKQRSALKHESFATKATEKRLELINSSRQKKIKLEVFDLMEEEKPLGTKVVLEIPMS